MDNRITCLVTEDEAVLALRTAGCVFAEEEAAILVRAADDGPALTELVHRRAQGEPLEQVVGHADFAGIRVRVSPGVFVPRVRSELLVREALKRTAEDAVIVDLCCGSGALGLAVKHHRPAATLHAADLDPVAVACARDNLGDRGQVHQGDLFEALPETLEIDVLLANVPYVATDHLRFLPPEARDHEPRTALDGGSDGLDVFRAVITAAPTRLARGGALFSEITEAQIDPAVAAVRRAGLRPEIVTDDDLEATVVIAVR